MSFKEMLRLFGGARPRQLLEISRRRQAISIWSDAELKSAAARARARPSLVEVFALTAVIAERVLGLAMFDEQLAGAMALQRGQIVEMQTGEGKTLAAVPAIVWYACAGRGVHVLTANDFLAQRDAGWMAGIYDWFGFSAAHLSQKMGSDERRAAYRADITYATANEVGFDYLRDGLARSPGELVQRAFAFAVIDEADSILIDEARIPLVIAGGAGEDPQLACRADQVVRLLRADEHFRLDEFGRNAQLTDSGIERVEHAFSCGNLFEERNLAVLTAVGDALHAHVLLNRDVDYLVKNGAVELVDAFKGRVAENRRWQAGLQAAIEAKEGVRLNAQGRILGSITVQNLVAMYEGVCGMTGTAATQAEEFWKIYRLPVAVIPTHRPVIRRDLPDAVFPDQDARNEAVVKEIRDAYGSGRPVLVGTASVEQSEALSRRLQSAGVTHQVLNARNDEAEAAIVAQAGALGAVTISTNMAGRGTDIILGGNPPVYREQVVELGGLYVIGTTRHEAARIDNQLRGRAGRQGDPGTSRFLLSLDDELLVRFGVAENPDIDSVQRIAESQNLAIRQFLFKYDSLTEHHRRQVYARRREVLLSPEWSVASLLPEEQYAELARAAGPENLAAAARPLVLGVMDDLWADYLANVSELKGGIHWVSWDGSDPLYKYLAGVQEIYADFERALEEEIAAAFGAAEIREDGIHFPQQERYDRGATWTYITTDQPFGSVTERLLKGLRTQLTKAIGRA